MHVNTSTSCVNKWIFVFCKSQNYFSIRACAEVWLLLWTPPPWEALSLKLAACVLRVKTTLWAVVCCSQCDLSSPRYIVTCTHTFRKQVSYSLVVEVCSVHSVRSAGWQVWWLFVSTAFHRLWWQYLLRKYAGVYESASHDLKKWDTETNAIYAI